MNRKLLSFRSFFHFLVLQGSIYLLKLLQKAFEDWLEMILQLVILVVQIQLLIAYQMGTGIYDMTGPSVGITFMGYARKWMYI